MSQSEVLWVEVTCPHCQARNRVAATLRPDDPQSIACSVCRSDMGTWRELRPIPDKERVDRA